MIEWDIFNIRAAEFKDGKLANPPDAQTIMEDWPATGHAAAFLGFTLNRRRLLGIFLVFVLAVVVLFYRVFTLQVIDGDYYRKVAEGNRIRVSAINGPRGIIYDRQQRTLVKNVPSFQLVAMPADMPEDAAGRAKILVEAAQLLGETGVLETEVEQKIAEAKDKYRPIIIRENIEYEKALLAKIKSSDWPGLSLQIGNVRDYLTMHNGVNSMAHLLGYTGPVSQEDIDTGAYAITDRTGKIGMELSYEKILRGRDGREQIEVDALGKTKKILAREAPKPGRDLVLSVDIEVQNKLTDILVDNLKVLRQKKGAAIVLDPNNGEILAAVSWPTYDNNLFSRGISPEDYNKLVEDKNLPLFNRLLSGEYPSGSTFKPVVAAAALEEGVVNRNTVVNSVGGLKVNIWFFPDWKAGGHGYTNVTKALAWSVNTFFYMVGGGHNNFKGLGVNKIIRYAQYFGFGKALGVDLVGEKEGFLPTPEWKEQVENERWYIGDTYHLAIGQGGLLVTPLQIAAATAAFANGGKVYRPHFVKSINTVEHSATIEPQVLSQDFISAANLAIVKQGLRETVAYGSARSLAGLNIMSAGKTGTAQWKKGEADHAWFTGFAPYIKPEIVITVLIEEGGEGSSAAVPIAKQFYDWYFNVYKKSLKKLTTN